MTSEIEKVTPARSRAARPSTARKTAAEKTASKVPAGARKPADHASAKTDVKPKVVEVQWREDPETGDPFVYSFDPEQFDDLDYVDALISMETSKTQAEASTYAYIALKTVLGPENFELYKEREKLTQGKATFSGSLEFFNSMMEQMKKGNSGPSPAA